GRRGRGADHWPRYSAALGSKPPTHPASAWWAAASGASAGYSPDRALRSPAARSRPPLPYRARSCAGRPPNARPILLRYGVCHRGESGSGHKALRRVSSARSFGVGSAAKAVKAWARPPSTDKILSVVRGQHVGWGLALRELGRYLGQV